MAAICGLRAYIGLTHVDSFVHDAFVLLDSAWRMQFGERPHLDFYTPLGPVAFLPTLMGLWASSGTAQGFGYGQAMAGALLGGWAYVLARRRLSDVPLCLFCVSVTLTAVGVSVLGMSPLNLTPGMTYNRFGFALVELIVLEAAVAPGDTRGWRSWIGGISTGAALALLLFLKISFFLITAPIVVLFIPCRVQEKFRAGAFAAGFLAVLLCFSYYFGFHAGPMIQDLAIAAKAKEIDLGWYYSESIVTGALSCAALGIAAGLLAGSHGAWTNGLRLIQASFTLAVFGPLLVITNFEQSGFPLCAVFALVAANAVNLVPTGAGRRFPILLWCSVFVLCAIGSDAVGLCLGAARQAFGTGSGCRTFDTEKLRGFSVCGPESSYVDYVQEGFRLIDSHRQEGDSVFSMDFSNPFSYGLGMTPMQGGTNAQDFQTTFSRTARPAPERLFGSATLVMAPKAFSNRTLGSSEYDIYGPFLKEHFVLIDESPYWWLYQRKEQEPI